MKLSTKSRYGARILMELARHLDKGPLQVSAISKMQDIPFKYLEQLIRTLKKANLVKSLRGPKGGHVLAKSPEKITLGDVVRLFEGQTVLVACISSPEQCSKADECQVRLAWKEANDVLYAKLDKISIDDLVKKTTWADNCA